MDEHPSSPSRWRSPLGLYMLVAGAVGIYYLLTEHLTHVTQAIPYLFLLACPVMHLFHGHGLIGTAAIPAPMMGTAPKACLPKSE